MGMSLSPRARIVKLARWIAQSTSLDYSTETVCRILPAPVPFPTPHPSVRHQDVPGSADVLTVYEILSVAGLIILFEVGLALWVGKRLDQVARSAGETESEPVPASQSKEPSA